MSADFGDTPWRCDAGTMTWCSRPRLYWLTWELEQQSDEVEFEINETNREVTLYANQHLDEDCCEGWTKVDPERQFPTFTTSRPPFSPGYKPAGVKQCTEEELHRWVNDSYRFPPYQYSSKNCMISIHSEPRLPSVEEKEIMMVFPLRYTQFCVPQGPKERSCL